jgi:hypothetical protein
LSSWYVAAQAMNGTPGLEWLAVQFNIRLLGGEKSHGVMIETVDQIATRQTLDMLLKIDAESDAIARERAYAFLDDVCRNAEEWQQNCGIRFLSNTDNDDAEGLAIEDIFEVTSVVVNEEAAV